MSWAASSSRVNRLMFSPVFVEPVLDENPIAEARRGRTASRAKRSASGSFHKRAVIAPLPAGEDEEQRGARPSRNSSAARAATMVSWLQRTRMMSAVETVVVKLVVVPDHLGEPEFVGIERDSVVGPAHLL